MTNNKIAPCIKIVSQVIHQDHELWKLYKALSELEKMFDTTNQKSSSPQNMQ